MTPDLLSLLRDNILERGNPLGLPGEELCRWARGLEIPQTGETILYTGCEYQLLPYLPSLLELAEKMGPFGLRSGPFVGAARALGRLGLDPARTIASMRARDKGLYDGLLQRFARVLRGAGVDFAYLGEDEPYAGGLLYEFGFLEELAAHAQRVYEIFKGRGVKRIIAVSPHSMELFRKIYPLYVEFDLTVLHYTQVLTEALEGRDPVPVPAPPTTVTIHDPCHLARDLGIVAEPRAILQALGVGIKEVEPTHGRWTGCCGAPLEVLLPQLRELVARRRLEELMGTGAESIVTLCPFCYFNFRRALPGPEVEVRDLIEILDEVIHRDG